MTLQSPSQMVCSALPVGWLSGMDLTANISMIDAAADMRRSWNGEARNFADPLFNLYRVELSSGAGEYLTPALADLTPGTQFDIVIDGFFDSQIPSGGTMKTLPRTPHPDFIIVKNLAWDDVPFTVDGRLITLAEPADGPIRIRYRPILTVVVWEPVKWSVKANSREVSWSLVTEELGGSA